MQLGDGLLCCIQLEWKEFAIPGQVDITELCQGRLKKTIGFWFGQFSFLKADIFD